MSSPPCLGTVERTCGFELEILKSAPSPSSSARSSCSSECSSVAISTKRARTPRKRPNQSYAEAAILLSTAYPNVFNTKSLPKLRKHHATLLSAPFQANYLIEEDPSPYPCRKLPCPFEFKSASAPGSPDYDVESILDEEEVGEEGNIDSIMGKLSMENPEAGGDHALSPLLRGLVGFGIGGRFGQLLVQNNVRHALRCARGGDWWSASTMVEVRDIVPRLDPVPPTAKKKKKSSKKKKKVVKEEEEEEEDGGPQIIDASSEKPRTGLGLKLNYEGVVEAWSDRQFPFTKEAGAPEYSADAIAKLAEVDLTPDTDSAGAREASVQRFREKRRTRLFSKKIRYQVRKVNADCRPRMKGRFIRRPTSPLDEAEEGNP